MSADPLDAGEIAERFKRAAEIERNTREHVGPSQMRSLSLGYVHDYVDKLGWGKAPGDKLDESELDRERELFFERLATQPTASEISAMDEAQGWLISIGSESERRALLAWARSRTGGKSFRRWCFQVEKIHPNTGRARKDRAIEKIRAMLAGEVPRPEPDQVEGESASDIGARDGLNSWMAVGSFARIMPTGNNDFSWAEKQSERRRQARQRKAAKAARKEQDLNQRSKAG